MSRSKKMFIQNAIKRPGALHKALHIPIGEKIPEKKIKKAEHSKNSRIRKEANFAETLKNIRTHKKSGGSLLPMIKGIKNYKEKGSC
jgi:hypothetical protein